MPDPVFHTDAVDWRDIGNQLAAGFIAAAASGNVADGVIEVMGKQKGAAMSTAMEIAESVALKMGETLHAVERPFMPIIAAFVAPIVAGLFGAEVNEAEFTKRLVRGGGHAAARAIVDGFLKAIEGDGAGELRPSPEGGARVASAAVAASLESTFNALIPELLSDCLPFEIGHFKELTELPEGIIRALGVGRLVRRAVGPLVTVCAATPMLWHVNKKYRPTLLGPGEVVRQALREKWSKAEAIEELARQGYSDKRIEALFNAGAKFFSVGDVRTFLSREEWTNEQAIQHLKDQGYDQATAHDALRLEGLRRFDQLETQEANVIIGAYAARDIDRSTFGSMLDAAVSVASERALFTELAEIRRACNIKRLTLSQVEAMVRSGVLNVRDYRETAQLEGYSDGDVTALELQLRWELDKEKAIEAHRAELEAERLAAKIARELALAERKAQIAAERALARRGNEADLERAAVRGQIAIGRVEEVYAQRYDPDTVQILVASLEDDRQAYIDQQTARDAAIQRGKRRNIDVGAVEQAFYTNLLTADELRARLAALGFNDADADLLTATAVAKKAELDAAKARRDATAAVAAKKQIDLGRFERLVRRGDRTMAQYVTLLQSLDVDEAAIPDFVDALQVLINDDAAARDARRAAEPALNAKGLSLEQMRRAVLLDIRTRDDFQAFLVANHFTSDAQAVLLAELDADVADAEAARRRRTAPAPGPQPSGSPLSTIRRAAQLGIVSPDVYLQRLADAGYGKEDLAIETDLLLLEISDVQAARARRDQAPAAAPPPGLSLETIGRAVKAGTSSIDLYRARAVELGYSLADVDILAALLTRELETLNAGRTAHSDVGFRLAPQGLSLAELDARVTSGELTLEDYAAQLEAWGVGPDDAQLVAAFLAWQLEQKPSTGGA